MKKKKLLIGIGLTMLIGIIVAAVVFDKKNDKPEESKFVISNEYVDIVQYKGLEYEKFSDVTTESEIDVYIVEIMNHSLDPKKNEKDETISYSIEDLTDDVVSKISAKDYNTVKEYKAYVKQILDQQKKNGHLENTKNSLFNSIVEKSVLKTYQEDKHQNYIDYLNEYYQKYAEYLEIDFEKFYTTTMGFSTREEYDSYVKEEALNDLKIEYIIKAIADAEKIEITEDEIKQQIDIYIENEQFEKEEDVLQYISKDEIIMNLKYYEILEIIFENAKEVEPKKEEVSTQVPDVPASTNNNQTQILETESTTEKTEGIEEVTTEETQTNTESSADVNIETTTEN